MPIKLSKSELQNPNDIQIILKRTTPARICVGRSGDRYKTKTLLQLWADHAIAIDAVWSRVDPQLVEEMGFYAVQTLVSSLDEYIKRPDLGRRFAADMSEHIQTDCIQDPDVQILIGDGLSGPAIENNIRDIYPIIVDGVNAKGWKLGTPIFIKYARVATMDRISETLHPKVTLILIGERPGLAVGDSMSCYMAYEASTTKLESQRNVISNIHRRGTPPVEAGAQIVYLIERMLTEQQSGTDLKI